MSLPAPNRQLSFFHVSELAGTLFEDSDRYSLFREHILPAFETIREQVESLYCAQNGRPAIDPVRMAAVTILQFMEKVLSSQAEHHEDQPSQLYVDAGYISEDTLAEAKENGIELNGPARPPGNPHKLLGIDRFRINIKERKAVCPAGHTNTQCSRVNDTHQQSVYYRFEWGALCDGCPLQKQCTKAKSGRRLVCVGVRHDLLQQRRDDMKTEAFQEEMKQRNAIEGTISELMRGGMRRTRYRGLAKTALANYFNAAACNINRWFRRVQPVEAHGM